MEGACRLYAAIPVRRLLEPGCGGGRMIRALARRGYQMTGFDNNPRMLAYARRRLGRQGLRARLFRADLARFRTPSPVDAAYCLWDTFRHLLTEREALAHLESVARAVRSGGIYLLGLHLLPPDAAEECTERWSARRGATRLTATLRVTASDRRRRRERLRLSLRVRTPARERRIRSEFALRLYTAAQLKRLLARVPGFELAAVHDYWFEMDRTFPLDDRIADAVLVLRRREG